MEDRVDLVIFDCDGTLVDSEVLSIKVDQRVLADHGWNLSQEDIVARFMGRTSTYFTRELESFLGRAQSRSGWPSNPHLTRVPQSLHVCAMLPHIYTVC